MEGNLKPANVSPFIRGARIIFLLLGVSYGSIKLNAFREIEKSAKPKREKKYAEQHAKERAEALKAMRKDLAKFVAEIELPDIPEGWEQDIE